MMTRLGFFSLILHTIKGIYSKKASLNYFCDFLFGFNW